MSGVHDKPILDEMIRVGGRVGVCDETIKVSKREKIRIRKAVPGSMLVVKR
jgi:hypothetical protein